MSEVRWSGTPAAGVPEWSEDGISTPGRCGSCGKPTQLRPDPIAQQLVCRPCWEGLMFDDD